MSFRPPYHKNTDDAAIQKNLEQNLDFIHKTHMNAILHAYNEGKLPHTRELCIRAMDNYRLPQYYRNVYEDLVKKIDATLAEQAAAVAEAAAAKKRDQATTTEEIAATMLHALNVTTDEGNDEKVDKKRGLESIIDKAEAIGVGGTDAEKAALFDELLEVVNNEASNDGKKDSMDAHPTDSRRSSH